jgi:hypothetical protein
MIQVDIRKAAAAMLWVSGHVAPGSTISPAPQLDEQHWNQEAKADTNTLP